MRKMRINDIFYSLQGEGYNTGRAAVFVRFAGCNLRCSFCDTEFDSYREMTPDEVVAEVASCGSTLANQPLPLVVLTGGEPTLQVDEAFVDLLHQHGYEVAMESNGTRPAPRNLDWLTVSPKTLPQPPSRSATQGDACPEGLKKGKAADEVKIVFTTKDDVERLLPHLSLLLEGGGARLFLQPCDTGDPQRNEIVTISCIAYIKQHPQWRLSLQTHKLAGFK